ncbi:MAG TPA: type II toxin-antitoxin system VapC family toxin [Verrucomicrobiales bacterium]|nr:type II toxin-antitoxin system VapC family toxin [Verrucomicrobiales bacterium]
MIFFDTSYLVRLYLDEKGSEAVRALAETAPIASSWHAQAELLCTFHRAYREGRLDKKAYQAQRSQFSSDQSAFIFHWLPVTEATLSQLDATLANAPATAFLRAADGLHLACAAEHGFKEVYSNDSRFLAAAPLFNLKGVDVIEVPSS